jgi:hypothetical protein
MDAQLHGFSHAMWEQAAHIAHSVYQSGRIQTHGSAPIHTMKIARRET